MNRELLTPEELEALLAREGNPETASSLSSAPNGHDAENSPAERALAEERLQNRVRELSDQVLALTERMHAVEQELAAFRSPAAASELAAAVSGELEACPAAKPPVDPIQERITISRAERHKPAKKKWFK